MSKDKTCGACKHYSTEMYHCQKHDAMAESFNTCEDFEPKVVTIGDRIKQMNNTDLAEMLVYPVKPININGHIYYEFTSCLLLGKSYFMREQAVFLTERRLNAPVESEADNTEGEVNNEQ